jgi:hypothetical protein
MGLYYNQNTYNYAYYGAGYVYNAIGAIPITFAFHGSFANPIQISGNIDITPAFAGHLSAILSVSGQIPITVPIIGHETGVWTLSANLTIVPSFAANALSGPLWASVPCPAPPWAAGQPCPPPLWGPDPDIETSEPWVPSELCD